MHRALPRSAPAAAEVATGTSRTAGAPRLAMTTSSPAGAVAHQQRQQHPRRGPVGLGKIDVEGDDRGAGLGELFDKLGDDRPRPWPLPDRGEAFVVDIDDRDRRIRRRSRRHALIEIEGDQRQPTQEIGGEDPGRRCDQQEREPRHHRAPRALLPGSTRRDRPGSRSSGGAAPSTSGTGSVSAVFPCRRPPAG